MWKTARMKAVEDQAGSIKCGQCRKPVGEIIRADEVTWEGSTDVTTDGEKGSLQH